MIIEQDDDYIIEHFGVRGMRWGVRKSPEQVKARREEKAKPFRDKAEIAQKEINRIKSQPPRNIYMRGVQKRRIKDLQEEKSRALDDARRKQEGKLSKHQRNVAIGAGSAAAVLAAYGTYRAAESGKIRQMITVGKAHIFQEGVSGKKNAELAKENMSISDLEKNVVPQINKGYGAAGTKVNCRRCTFAYEMRRRGYDVAATKTPRGSGQTAFGLESAITPGKRAQTESRVGLITKYIRSSPKEQARIINLAESPVGYSEVIKGSSDYGNVFKAAAQHGNGARGEVGLTYRMGGGHSMAWEIVNGKAVFFDTQTGDTMRNAEEFAAHFGENAHLLERIGLTRLDNLPLNNEFLTRWVKNAA